MLMAFTKLALSHRVACSEVVGVICGICWSVYGISAPAGYLLRMPHTANGTVAVVHVTCKRVGYSTVLPQ